MCSRFRELVAVLLAVAGVPGCEREQRRFSEPAGDVLAVTTSLSDIQYDENAFAISEGQRLYEWFNCSGCHAHGGGALGPALMDDTWIYGGEPDQIYSTIVQGRPNGMPAFGARIPRQQVWQLVAFVRSLSGQLRNDVEPGRADAMQMRPAPAQTREPPRAGKTP
jgi:cytochrome c oxidase cbb3-type subunit III